MKKNKYKELNKIYKTDKGLSNYAFSLYLFIKTLREKCIEDNISDIFFFSREGLFLKRLYDVYDSITDESTNIETHYMYISRRAVMNATLKSIDEETFAFLEGYKNIDTITFLGCLGFTNEEIERLAICNSEKYTDFKSFIGSLSFKMLKECQPFIELYEQKRLEARASFEAYLKTINFESSNEKCVVDVGWNGTIQDGVFKALNNNRLTGYYLGTFQNSCTDTNTKEGLLFSRVSMNEPFCYKRYNFEYICVANHGATEGYDNNGTPIFVEDYDMHLYNMFFKDIQDSIVQKFRDIHCAIKMNKITGEQLVNYIKSRHALMLLFLPNDDKQIIKYAVDHHPDNFINIKFRKTIKYFIYIALQKIVIMTSAVKHAMQSFR